MYLEDWFGVWDQVAKIRTPMIAAVAGHALGGGCELAMICDIIIAADNAKFGQPEIKLGVIPGMGGSQRLTRAIGKAKAMEMVLTGRTMGAEEAERSGLVARVVPVATLMDDALVYRRTIAGMSKPVTMLAKEAVNAVFEGALPKESAWNAGLTIHVSPRRTRKRGCTLSSRSVPRISVTDSSTFSTCKPTWPLTRRKRILNARKHD
jgi:enoyl-CoA hydratase/carnithine racemase